MKRVAMYLRLSEEDDIIRDESNSITSQRELLRKHFRSIPEFHDFELVEFKDDGYTGKNMNRPGMQELLVQVKRGNVEAILVKDISRFSRDHLVSGRYLEQIFPFMGVRFIAVNDSYDSANFAGGIGEIDVAFKEILYDYYSEDLSVKVKSALITAGKNGRYVGAFTPYGYRKDEQDRHKVVVDEESASVVREIFAMAAEGMSMHGIARNLNDRGIDSPGAYNLRMYGLGSRIRHDRPVWYTTTVSKILHDEFYKGTYAFKKTEATEVGINKRIINDKDEWLRIPDHHEPLIPSDEFDRVQEVLLKSSSKGRKMTKRPPHMLVGKVICGCCGAYMTHSWDYKGQIPALYRCSRTSHFTGGVHEKVVIKDHELEKVIFAELTDEVQRQADMQEIRAAVREAMSDRIKNAQKYITDAENRLDKVYFSQKESYEAYRLGRLTRDQFLTEKKRLEQMEVDARMELQQGRECLSEREEKLDEVLREDTLLGDALATWNDDCEVLTKEMCDAFVDKVTVWPGGRVEIGWKFGDAEGECTQI